MLPVAVAGEAAPKVLEPNAGVALVLLLAAAAPKLPNVGVFVDGLPKIGVLDVAAAGEPKTGAALDASEELLLLAPKVNADEDDDSAGFGVVVAEAAAAPKLNPDVPVEVALPKIPVDDAAAFVFAAGVAVAAAPKLPNVGLSVEGAAGDAAAAAPKVGTTLLAD